MQKIKKRKKIDGELYSYAQGFIQGGSNNDFERRYILHNKRY